MGKIFKKGALKIFWGFLSFIIVSTLMGNIFELNIKSIANLDLDRLLSGNGLQVNSFGISFGALLRIGALIFVMLGLIDIRKVVRNAVDKAFGLSIAMIVINAVIMLFLNTYTTLVFYSIFNLASTVLLIIMGFMILKGYVKISSSFGSDNFVVEKNKKRAVKSLVWYIILIAAIAVLAIIVALLGGLALGVSNNTNGLEAVVILVTILMVAAVFAMVVFIILYYVFISIALYKGGRILWHSTGEFKDELEFKVYKYMPQYNDDKFELKFNSPSSNNSYQPQNQNPVINPNINPNLYFKSEHSGVNSQNIKFQEVTSYARNTDREDLPPTEGLRVKNTPPEGENKE